jgi:hypothetical protein
MNKFLFLFILTSFIAISCNRKTPPPQNAGDTLYISPPAARDTLIPETRPTDSLLQTKKR